MAWCRTCRFGGRFEVQLVAKMVTQIAEVVPEVPEKHICAQGCAQRLRLEPAFFQDCFRSAIFRFWIEFDLIFNRF